MVRSNSGTPTTGAYFEAMCKQIKLLVVVHITIPTKDEIAVFLDYLDILTNPNNNKDSRPVKCIFMFDGNPAEVLQCYYGLNKNIDSKITSLISYIGRYTKSPCEPSVISSQELIDEGEIFSRIFCRNENNPMMEFNFTEISTLERNVTVIDDYLNIYRKKYLKDGYGRRCDELYQALLSHSEFRIDPPDQQVSNPSGKMNYCHFTIDNDYAFYLVDYFFDLSNDVDIRWKHYKRGQGTTPRFNVSKEIKKLLEEGDFVIPPNIS
ncbi:TPA: hypothetical protein ACGO1Y_001533 [Streptococcus suis]